MGMTEEGRRRRRCGGVGGGGGNEVDHSDGVEEKVHALREGPAALVQQSLRFCLLPPRSPSQSRILLLLLLLPPPPPPPPPPISLALVVFVVPPAPDSLPPLLPVTCWEGKALRKWKMEAADILERVKM
eukprot:340625-Hanusia_phi.AAC.1